MKIAYQIGFALLMAFSSFGQSRIVWDESVNGPISEIYQNPTSFGSLQLGTNTVIGQSALEYAGGNWLNHHNYFTINVDGQHKIRALILQVDRPSFVVWIGDTGYSSQLGAVTQPSNGDILPQMGLSSIGPDFYGMYGGNHDNQPFNTIANFRLDFIVEPIPEPSIAALFGLGAFVLSFRQIKSRK